MADYRCYCLDRHGCVRAVTGVAADTDERARASVVVLLATCAHDSAEIWDGRRRVGLVERFRDVAAGPATSPLRRGERPSSVTPPPPQAWNRGDQPHR